MRVLAEQIDFLKREILLLVPDAVVYLFGSRVDDKKKGGDIDIMILSDRKISWKEKAKIKWRYFEKFGEQKIDIVSSMFNENNPFKELVLQEGIRL
ncbi:MAG: nucleotidyltransferase domain-containing protein [bacterium]